MEFKELEKRKCDICGCEHEFSRLKRVNMLNLKGSEDDYICNRCNLELVHFARSMQTIADKVRMESYNGR